MDRNLFVSVLSLHKGRKMQIHFCGMEMQGSRRGCRTQPGVVLAFTTTSVLSAPVLLRAGVFPSPDCRCAEASEGSTETLRRAPNGVWSSLPLRR